MRVIRRSARVTVHTFKHICSLRSSPNRRLTAIRYSRLFCLVPGIGAVVYNFPDPRFDKHLDIVIHVRDSYCTCWNMRQMISVQCITFSTVIYSLFLVTWWNVTVIRESHADALIALLNASFRIMCALQLSISVEAVSGGMQLRRVINFSVIFYEWYNTVRGSTLHFLWILPLGCLRSEWTCMPTYLHRWWHHVYTLYVSHSWQMRILSPAHVMFSRKLELHLCLAECFTGLSLVQIWTPIEIKSWLPHLLGFYLLCLEYVLLFYKPIYLVLMCWVTYSFQP